MWILTRLLTTDASAFPRPSPVGVWLLLGAFVAFEDVAAAPGLWLYCNEAGEGAPVPLLAATAPLPRNVDIGGKEAALVTAEPRIGAAGSPFGDIAEYVCTKKKKKNMNIFLWRKRNVKLPSC